MDYFGRNENDGHGRIIRMQQGISAIASRVSLIIQSVSLDFPAFENPTAGSI